MIALVHAPAHDRPEWAAGVEVLEGHTVGGTVRLTRRLVGLHQLHLAQLLGWDQRRVRRLEQDEGVHVGELEGPHVAAVVRALQLLWQRADESARMGGPDGVTARRRAWLEQFWRLHGAVVGYRGVVEDLPSPAMTRAWLVLLGGR